jgi:hypothetical protein
MGRRLRRLFQEAGFGRVAAFADYISYGTPEQVMAFARDRAEECRDQQLRAAVSRQGIASDQELGLLAAAWEEWGKDAGAFFAFAWCRVLAWPLRTLWARLTIAVKAPAKKVASLIKLTALLRRLSNPQDAGQSRPLGTDDGVASALLRCCVAEDDIWRAGHR